jgi:hypothetical protein
LWRRVDEGPGESGRTEPTDAACGRALPGWLTPQKDRLWIHLRA